MFHCFNDISFHPYVCNTLLDILAFFSSNSTLGREKRYLVSYTRLVSASCDLKNCSWPVLDVG